MIHEWSFDRTIGVIALIVTVGGIFVGLFQPEVRHWLGLLRGLPRFRITFLLLAVCGLAGSFFVGFAWHRTTFPLVLVGSSNVAAYLERKPPLDEMKSKALWLDVPSEDALGVLFHSFEYGADSTKGNNRAAVLGLSSYGTKKLEDLVGKVTPEDNKWNYWLSIQVAEAPLVVLYARPTNAEDRKLFPDISEDPNSDYNWITCAHLKNFFQQPSTGHISRYAPEPNTGTRAAFEKWCGETGWRNDYQYPRPDIESLAPPFVDLMSVPMYRSKKRAATCAEIKQHQIKVAVLCPGQSCADPKASALTPLVAVMKITPDGDDFRITNDVECEIAQEELTKEASIQVTACRLKGVKPDEYHIVRSEVQNIIREYAKCK